MRWHGDHSGPLLTNSLSENNFNFNNNEYEGNCFFIKTRPKAILSVLGAQSICFFHENDCKKQKFYNKIIKTSVRHICLYIAILFQSHSAVSIQTSQKDETKEKTDKSSMAAASVPEISTKGWY